MTLETYTNVIAFGMVGIGGFLLFLGAYDSFGLSPEGMLWMVVGLGLLIIAERGIA